ncbi:MAG TPA: hypothetical protein VM934_00260 [Pyrinomonadaceae bacterium]|jgi:uncharacterized membrane protein YphA (DoxX/SURF4 family)|nr:hypothetical protein [Pyrinomonadaceae bacterium]
MVLRLFSLTYPDGRPGVGLLLLRSALGLTAATQGVVCLSSRDDLSLWTAVACLLAVTNGPLLLIGFLTPLACVIVGLGSTAVAFSMLTAEARGVLPEGLFFFFVTSMATAAMLLGPGAYSLDARLFGRREIIIPQSPRPSKP